MCSPYARARVSLAHRFRAVARSQRALVQAPRRRRSLERAPHLLIAPVAAPSTPASSSLPAALPTGHPWRWVPSLYFAQGLPYVVVMTVSVVMYKRLGISNSDIA